MATTSAPKRSSDPRVPGSAPFLDNNLRALLRGKGGSRGAPTGTGKQKRKPVSNELQSRRRGSRARNSQIVAG